MNAYYRQWDDLDELEIVQDTDEEINEEIEVENDIYCSRCNDHGCRDCKE